MNTATITPQLMIVPDCPSPANLFQALTPARGAQKRPDQFASLAHEIRNPLSTINLSVQMLKSIVTGDDQKVFLEMIIRSSLRINEILADVHSSFRADEMQAEKCSIHQLLDEVLEMAHDKIMLKHIAVRKDYAANDSEIVLNKARMKIALTNIVINAIDAMTEGKGILTIITKSSDHTCIVRIEDNGCGISQENLKNIFKPYFSNKQGGLGLGLATTHDILLSNHVRLNVKSEETKGSSFIMLFEKH